MAPPPPPATKPAPVPDAPISSTAPPAGAMAAGLHAMEAGQWDQARADMTQALHHAVGADTERAAQYLVAVQLCKVCTIVCMLF